VNIAIIIILAVVAVIDFGLIYLRQPTISQRYQALFPAYMDLFILALLIPGVCYVDIHPTLKVLLGVLAGHLFWAQHERSR